MKSAALHRSFRRGKKNRRRNTRRHKLAMEFLEHRRVLTTTYAVTTTDDVVDANDGELSLREAVIAANNNGNDNEFDIINLEPGKTYELTQGELEIEASVNFFGARDFQSEKLTTIDAQGLSRIFNVKDGRFNSDAGFHFRNNANFTDLRLTGGYAEKGAAVWNSGTVTFVGCEIDGNQATGTEQQIGPLGPAVFNLTNPDQAQAAGLVQFIETSVQGNLLSDSSVAQTYVDSAAQAARDAGAGLVEGVNAFIDVIEFRLDEVLEAPGSLPLVGDRVRESADEVFAKLEAIRGEVLDILDEVVNLDDRQLGGRSLLEVAQGLLFMAFSAADRHAQLDDGIEQVLQPYRSRLVNRDTTLLNDGPDTGNEINPTDIVAIYGMDARGKQWVEFKMWLGQRFVVDLDAFDIGLASAIPFMPASEQADLQRFLDQIGFDASLEGGLRLDMRWDVRMGVGASQVGGQQFFLNSGATFDLSDESEGIEEFKLSIEAFSLPPNATDGFTEQFVDITSEETDALSGEISLGLLQATVSDGTPQDVTLTAADALTIPLFVGGSDSVDADFQVIARDGDGNIVADTPISFTIASAEPLAVWLPRLNAKILTDVAGGDPLSMPYSITSSFGRIDRFFNAPGTPTTPSLVIGARDSRISSLEILGGESLGFLNEQVDDGRPRSVGFGNGDTSTAGPNGTQVLQATSVPPIGGQLTDDVDFILSLDGSGLAGDYKVRVNTSELDNRRFIGDLGDLRAQVESDAQNLVNAFTPYAGGRLTINVVDDTGKVYSDEELEVDANGVHPSGPFYFQMVMASDSNADPEFQAAPTLTVTYRVIDQSKLALGASIDVEQSGFSSSNLDDPRVANDQRFFDRVSKFDLSSASDITELFVPTLAADMSIRLHTVTGASGVTGFIEQGLGLANDSLGMPELEFDFKFDAELDFAELFLSGAGADSDFFTTGSLVFDNITLDADKLIDTILTPIADATKELVSPLTDFFGTSQNDSDALINQRLPVISDIVGKVTLRDLLPSSFIDGIVDDISNLAAITDDFSASDLLGSFGNDEGQFVLGCLAVGTDPSVSYTYKTPLPCEVAEVIAEVNDFGLDSLLGITTGIDIKPGIFKVDLLKPSEMANLLLGQPATIASFGLPEVDFDGSASFGFEFEELAFNIGGTAAADVDLRLGYDTSGLASIISALRNGTQPDYTDLLDGLFIKNNPDGYEIGLTVGFNGSGKVGPLETPSVDFGVFEIGEVVLFEAEGSVDISGSIGLEIEDPNNDGKLRLQEILDITDDFKSPEKLVCIFDLEASGSVDVSGSATIADQNLGRADLGLSSGDFSLQDLLTGVFDIDCSGPSSPPPVIAEEIVTADGTALRVNTGPFATARLNGDTDDSDATSGLTITVTDNSSGDVTVTVYDPQSNGVLGNGAGYSKTFSSGSFTSLIVNGTGFDDTINASGVSSYPLQLVGGNGDDVLLGGGGDDLIDGGFGNDTVQAGAGADELIGGLGDDSLVGDNGRDFIDGGTGDDMIEGGSGDDELLGETGQDTILGGDGDDEIDGGSGDDLIDGGNHADVIYAGSGADTVSGSGGGDAIFGEGGADEISGGDGADMISGGSGDDILAGDGGNDTIDGGSGGDDIDGGDGSDQLLGGSSRDVITGGSGSDDISGGTGNDLLNGGAGVDTIDGQGGADEIDGGDDSAADQLIGGLGNDLIVLRQGDSLAQGDAGLDTLLVDLSDSASGANLTINAGSLTLGGDSTSIATFDLMRVLLGDGDDNVVVVQSPGTIELNAGDGSDKVTIRNASHSVTINADRGSADIDVQAVSSPSGIARVSTGMRFLDASGSPANATTLLSELAGAVDYVEGDKILIAGEMLDGTAFSTDVTVAADDSPTLGDILNAVRRAIGGLNLTVDPQGYVDAIITAPWQSFRFEIRDDSANTGSTNWPGEVERINGVLLRSQAANTDVSVSSSDNRLSGIDARVHIDGSRSGQTDVTLDASGENTDLGAIVLDGVNAFGLGYGSSGSVDTKSIESLTVLTGSGADNATIDLSGQTAGDISLSTGGGDDIVLVTGSGAHDGSINVDGQQNDDAFAIDSTASLVEVAFSGGEGDDSATVNDTPSATTMLRGDQGDDLFTVNGFGGDVDIDGNAGSSDGLVLNMRSEPSSSGGPKVETDNVESISVDATTLSQDIDWLLENNSSVGELRIGTTAASRLLLATLGATLTSIRMGQGADQVRVSGIANNTTIESGPSNDTLTIGSDSGSLAAIDGNLAIAGQTDTASPFDVLSIDASGQTSTLSVGQVFLGRGYVDGLGASGSNRVEFETVESLNVLNGAGSDELTVRETTVPTTIESGGGGDTVTVLSSNQNLTIDLQAATASATAINSVELDGTIGLGAVEIFGGGESDTVLINRSGDTSGISGDLQVDANGSTLSGFGSNSITLDTNVDRLDVTLGSGDDVVSYDNTATAAGSNELDSFNISGGVGNDLLEISTPGLGELSFNSTGQSGDDQLEVLIAGTPDPQDFADLTLSFDVTELVVNNQSNASSVNWTLASGFLQTGSSTRTNLLRTDGAQEVTVLAGSGGSDKLTFNANVQGDVRAVIDDDTVRVDEGKRVLSFDNVATLPGDAALVSAVSPSEAIAVVSSFEGTPSSGGEALHVYSFQRNSLAVYRKATVSGSLALEQVVPVFENNSLFKGDLALSNDGKHLYAIKPDSGSGDGGLAIFSRDLGTGAIEFVGFDSSEHGDRISAVPTKNDLLARSRSGLAASDLETLVILKRDTNTGAIASRQRITGSNPPDLRAFAVSPDGDYVFFDPADDNQALEITSNGGLLPTGPRKFTLLGRFPQQNPIIDFAVDFQNITDMVVSPDGKNLFVSTDKTIYVIGINSDASLGDNSGAYVRQDVRVFTVSNGDASFNSDLSSYGIGQVKDLEISADGKFLVSASDASNGQNAAIALWRIVTDSNGKTLLDSFYTSAMSGMNGAPTVIDQSDANLSGLVGPLSIDITPVNPLTDVNPANTFVYATSNESLFSFTIDNDGSPNDTSDDQLTFDQEIDTGTTTSKVTGLDAMAVSPDGNWLYAISPHDGGLLVFDATSGTPSLIQSLVEPFVGFDGLVGVTDIDADDDHVYVTSAGDGNLASASLIVFERDSNGTLSHVETELSVTGDAFQSVAIHPALDLVVVGEVGRFIVYTRDAQSGELSTPASTALAGISDLKISPDGNQLYINTETTLAAYSLDPATGARTPGDTFASGAGELVVSSDNRFIYVANAAANEIKVIERTDFNATTNSHVERQTLRNGQFGIRGLESIGGLSLSSDGQYLYASGSDGNALVVFERDLTTGELVFVQSLSQGVGGVQGLSGPRGVVAHPDGQRVFIASDIDPANDKGGLATFELNTPIPIPLQLVGNFSQIEGLEILTGSGNDVVTNLNAANTAATIVNTKSGADLVNLPDLSGTTIVQTGNGADTVEISSNASGTALSVAAGNGLDTVNIQRVGSQTQTQVLGGSQNDVFRVAGAGIPSDITQLAIAGNDPTGTSTGDTLLFDPAGNAVNQFVNPFTPSNGSVGISGNGTTNYTSIETFRAITPPVPSAAASSPIDEGSGSFNLDASGTNEFGNPTTYEWDINGDGLFGDATGAAPSIPWSSLASFGIVDDGTYRVALRATGEQVDGTFESADAFTTIVVSNVAPKIQGVTSDGPVAEGRPVTVTVNAIDPAGDADPLTYEFDFDDDGIFEQSNSTGVASSVLDQTGTQTVHVRVRDDASTINWITSSVDVTVDSVAPLIGSVKTSGPVNEGSAVTVEVDAQPMVGAQGPFTYEFDFDGQGYGSPSQSNTAHFTYSNDGVYTVKVRVTDVDGDATEGNATVAVNNVDPTIVSITSNGPVDEGGVATINVAAIDPGGNDTLVYEFDLDSDGVYESSSLDGSIDVIYPDDGQFIVDARVRDDFVPSALGSEIEPNNSAGTANNLSASFQNAGAGNYRANVFGLFNDANDYYAVEANAGDAYTINLLGRGVGGSVRVRVLDADGNQLNVFDAAKIGGSFGFAQFSVSNAQIQFAESGTYYFVVGASQVALGNYQLALNADTVDGRVPPTLLTYDRAGVDITVNNVAPIGQISSAQTSLGEGDVLSIDLSQIGQDPGADTLSGWDINWGDGHVESVPAGTASLTHKYADDGTFYVTASLSDEEGAYPVDAVQDSETIVGGPLTITVGRVDPTIQMPADTVMNEGDFILPLSATDPGDDTILTWEIDWGDGTPVQTLPGTATESTRFFDGGIGGTDYEITVRGTDEDGSYVSGSTLLTVNNLDPSLTLVSRNDPISEGGVFQIVVGGSDAAGDADPLTYEFDFGNNGVVDWTSTDGTGFYTFDDDGSYSVSVRVTDGDAGEQTLTLNDIVVEDAPPTLQVFAPNSVPEGSPLTINLAVSDFGNDSLTSYRIDWGDGTPIELVSFDPETPILSATHIYADGDTDATGESITKRTIRVFELTDEEGVQPTEDSVEVTVVNVSPAITISGAESVNEGDVFTLNLDEIVDPGDDAVQQFTVLWGDGTSDVYTSVGEVTHQYAEGPAEHLVRVLIRDEDGTVPGGSLSVKVNNIEPSLTLLTSVNQGGGLVEIQGTFTDPALIDLLEPHRLIIDWGDGSPEQTVLLAAGAREFSTTHQYPSSGSQTFDVEVIVSDDDPLGSLFAVDDTTAFEIDPNSGVVLRSFSIVSNEPDNLLLSGVPQGLAFDGQDLFVVGDDAAGTIYRFHAGSGQLLSRFAGPEERAFVESTDPSTGDVTQTLQIEPTLLESLGIQASSNSLFGYDVETQTVYQLDATNGAIRSRLVTPSGVTLGPGGLDWNNTTSTQFVADNQGNILELEFDFQAAESMVIERNRVAPMDLTTIGFRGIAVVGDRLFVGGLDGRIYELDPGTGATVRSFAAPSSGLRGLAGGPAKPAPAAESIGQVTVTTDSDATAPTLTVPSSLTGGEGQAIALPIEAGLVDTDGSETLSIELSNIPDGAVLSNDLGDQLQFVAGKLTLTPDQLVGLHITSPDNGEISLQVKAIATESFNGSTAETTAEILVGVANVAPSGELFGSDHWFPGVPFNLIAVISDPSSIDQLAGFTINVDWGDGTATTQGPGAFSPAAISHTYKDSGTYTVSMTAMDKDGGFSEVATKQVDVSQVIVVDGVLQIAGTNGDDEIDVQVNSSSMEGMGGNPLGYLHVRLDLDRGNPTSSSIQEFEFPVSEIDQLAILALGGNDSVHVRHNVMVDTVIDGGQGDDVLWGGRGDDILLGGPGQDKLRGWDGNDVISGGDDDDIIRGGFGDDILIGGDGADYLRGDAGSDLAAPDAFAYEESRLALSSLQEEWTRADISFDEKFDHVRGLGQGGLNAPYVLNDGTLIDDGDADIVRRKCEYVVEPVNAASSANAYFDPLDVNLDGAITSLDALIVINTIAAATSGTEVDSFDSLRAIQADVNGDNQVSSLDALLVINAISLAETYAEPEMADVVDRAEDDDQDDELMAILADDVARQWQ